VRSALALIVATLACQREGDLSARAEAHPALAAATGVVRADPDPAGRKPLILPLRGVPGDVELLRGHPDVPGELFVMRIRELSGSMVPPHSHPVDEHITVLQGTWYLGFGEVFDSAALRPLGPGSYAFVPRGTTMFGYAPKLAVVQVHGIGPFEILWRHGLRTLDDTGATSSFRFRRGDSVQAPLGSGRIQQAYGSGAIVQYEIETSAGERFMAEERAVQRP
jgi:hypothetical protein